MSDIYSTFIDLPTPLAARGGECFSAAPVSGAVHRIAKDPKGSPALLISTAPGHNRNARIRLEHLDVQHSVRCRITTESRDTEEGIFTVVRCHDADEELARYFLRAIDPVLRILGPTPSASAVSRVISGLVELFRALVQPPVKSVSGLWAELLLIRTSGEPPALLAAWHISPDDKYDFNAGSQRIEVKSSSQRERAHYFSLEQLTPPTGCGLVIASLFVERAGAGTSLGELIDEIRVLVSARPELETRLDRVVASTLGSALRSSLSERFDRELAVESLQFYDQEVVPTIQIPLPWGVSEVHFKADLGQATPFTRQSLKTSGGLFGAI